MSIGQCSCVCLCLCSCFFLRCTCAYAACARDCACVYACACACSDTCACAYACAWWCALPVRAYTHSALKLRSHHHAFRPISCALCDLLPETKQIKNNAGTPRRSCTSSRTSSVGSGLRHAGYTPRRRYKNGYPRASEDPPFGFTITLTLLMLNLLGPRSSDRKRVKCSFTNLLRRTCNSRIISTLRKDHDLDHIDHLYHLQ